jgi:hypothetical protein
MQKKKKIAFFVVIILFSFLGIQLWYQNGFFNVVLLGTEIFVDELINIGCFPCYFFAWLLIYYGK